MCTNYNDNKNVTVNEKKNLKIVNEILLFKFLIEQDELDRINIYVGCNCESQ